VTIWPFSRRPRSSSLDISRVSRRCFVRPGLRCSDLRNRHIQRRTNRNLRLRAAYFALRAGNFRLRAGNFRLRAGYFRLSKPYSCLRAAYFRLSKPYSRLRAAYFRLSKPYSCLRAAYFRLSTPYSCLRAVYFLLRSPLSAFSFPLSASFSLGFSLLTRFGQYLSVFGELLSIDSHRTKAQPQRIGVNGSAVKPRTARGSSLTFLN
jgi:hypothetical protein